MMSPLCVSGSFTHEPVDGQPRDLKASLFERVRRAEHRVVLDGGGDHVPAAVDVTLRDPLKGEVVALRAARRENDFFGRHPVIGSDLVPRLVDCLPRALTEPVDAGGIAKLVGEVRHHRLKHLGIERRGCGMVEVHHRHHSMAHRFNFPFQFLLSDRLDCHVLVRLEMF